MQIAGREVSDTAPRPYVIAEVAHAHEGDVERAKTITRAAVEAGADAVKYQVWSLGEYLTADHPEYEVYRKLQVQPEQWLDIMGYARSIGTTVIVDVDDISSADLAIQGGTEAFKIRTANISNHRLLEHVAATGKPILLATGASTMIEITEAIEALEAYGTQDLVLLHGFQAFPTRVKDTHLRTLGLLRERFAKIVGYADHVDGNAPEALVLPAMALAAGACVIEKHITIDRELGTVDYESSLNPSEFKQLVDQLAELWLALGHGEHELTEAEKNYRVRFKKSIVARCHIVCGQQITSEKLAFKLAPKLGMPPNVATNLYHKHATVDIPVDTVLSKEMMQ